MASQIESWRDYQKAGGIMGFTAYRDKWRRTGEEPRVEAQVSERTKRILGEKLPEQYPEYAAWVGAQPPTAEEKIAPYFVERAEIEEAEKAEAALPQPAVRWDVEIDEDTGYRVQVGYDADGNVVSYEPIGAPPTEPTRYGAPDDAPTDPFGRTATWNERLGSWDYPPEWGQPEAGWVSPFEEEEAARRAQEAQQRITIEQQQAQQQGEYYAWQQEEARRQYGAQLAAQPQSWLQYAAYTGEQPAIQPWMQPLMPQQYAELGAGAAIPGWQAPQAGQMGGAPAQGMAGLPELTRLSRQYQARMGPTATQQYLGYRQARTGGRPEEEQWRLWSGAPPGGQYQGLRYTR